MEGSYAIFDTNIVFCHLHWDQQEYLIAHNDKTNN